MKSELERLVSIANTGEKAVYRLKTEFPDEVEAYSPEVGWLEFGRNWTAGEWKYRIKQLPEVFDLQLMGNTKVELKTTELYVGSLVFQADQFVAAAKKLCRKSGSVMESASGKVLCASREGICCGEWFLSWSDADLILRALTKAG